MVLLVNGKSLLATTHKGGAVKASLTAVALLASSSRVVSRVVVFAPVAGDADAGRATAGGDRLVMRRSSSPLYRSAWARFVWEQLVLPFAALRYVRAHRDERYIVLNPTHSASLLLSFLLPTLTLIHSLGFRAPGNYAPLFRAYMRANMLLLRGTSDLIATVSEGARDAVERALAVRGVRVLHNTLPEPPAEASITGLPAPGSYVLFVGNFNPEKNLARLIGAASQAASEEPALRLLVAGAHKDIFTRHDVEASGPVEFLGYLDEARKWAYLRRARLVAVPSTGETFSLPILEAMTSGVPVLASDLPTLRGLFGDACRFVDPMDVPAMARALVELWRDDAQRRALAARGRIQAERYAPGRVITEWDVALAELAKLAEPAAA